MGLTRLTVTVAKPAGRRGETVKCIVDTGAISGITGTSPVIFGEKGDENLLGVVTLEVMGLFLDPLQRQLKPSKIMAAGRAA